MAGVEKRVRNGKVTWLARWRDPDGRSRKRSFQRRTDADRFVTKLAADLLRGDYVDPNDPTTVKEYSETWRLAQVHRPSTQAHVETTCAGTSIRTSATDVSLRCVRPKCRPGSHGSTASSPLPPCR